MSRYVLFGLLVSAITLSVAAVLLIRNAAAEPHLQQPLTASPVQRCMNLSGALEAPEEGLWGYTIRESDLRRIVDEGYDTVRLPVRWRLTDSQTGPAIAPDQLARVDEVIDQALGFDLQIILNVHHYNELNEDPNTHEPRIEAIWHQLGAHYANRPHTLIFELVNEPHSGMTIARTDALNRRLLGIVRARNPDRWVLYGTAEWGTLKGMLKSRPAHDARAIVGFHYYTPFEFTHQGASFVDPPPPTGRTWGSADERKALEQDFARAAQFRDRFGMPLLVGEFGVYHNVPIDQRAAWIRAVRRAAEAQEFGWCHWGWGTSFKTYDVSRETWLEPIRDALIPQQEPSALRLERLE